jgi:hypothetical protein
MFFFLSFVQVQLKSVFGLTSTLNTQLACTPVGVVAYASGCAVVLYDPRVNSQIAFLTHSAMKTVASLAFSSDSKYLAVGEVIDILFSLLNPSFSTLYCFVFFLFVFFSVG